MPSIEEMFSVRNRVFLFTGGAGILASSLAYELGKLGAKIVLTDIAPLEEKLEEFRKESIEVRGYRMDALNRAEVEEVAKKVIEEWGRVDALFNAAGGNMKDATTSPEVSFFDLPVEALQKVVNLNLFGGAIIPSQVFAKIMVNQEEGGCIINFSSMAALRPLTRVVGYSAAKAAVSNFTQWLAVYLAQNYTPKVRVNALAPGFFVTKQNYYLLYNEDGTLTPRGQSILAHTPCGRFGEPQDLLSTVLWLLSPASSFVTGVVVPVDGGFSAFSGV
ncbi:SDR family oxidoreductase [Thermatribacter velox]|jgi:NAD(P)-dependent dehydrogenase (short-subunit alcohol dehydrogenase family)|uniref:SDR family oxidoreductase n=1 Tax=Thermatribacter velox TaxID=3039681 RepID=A0ABZ2YE89_9BACT